MSAWQGLFNRPNAQPPSNKRTDSQRRGASNGRGRGGVRGRGRGAGGFGRKQDWGHGTQRSGGGGGRDARVGMGERTNANAESDEEDEETLWRKKRTSSEEPVTAIANTGGDSPEDIAAWIAARKRNFPTADNIERKSAEAANREARGELPTSSPVKRRKVAETPKESESLTNSQPDKSAKTEEKMDESIVESVLPKSTPAVTSTSAAQDSGASPSVKGGKQHGRLCRFYARGKCNNGDDCRFAHRDNNQPTTKGSQSKRTKLRNPKVATSLLRELLQKQVDNDFNMVLQCLRFITSSNFLQNPPQECDL